MLTGAQLSSDVMAEVQVLPRKIKLYPSQRPAGRSAFFWNADLTLRAIIQRAIAYEELAEELLILGDRVALAPGW